MTISATSPGRKETELPSVAATDAGSVGSPSSLRQQTTRGGLITVVAQGGKFVLRTGSMMVLARLLTPDDFGLVGMVTAFTGFLSLFKDAGLSMATVQRVHVTAEQVATLFWINVGVGAVLALATAFLAPVLAAFYHEPRLVWVTFWLAVGFIFSGAASQHQALLQREMKFGLLAVVDIVSLTLTIGLSIAMALAGLKYWALVGMASGLPALNAVGLWWAAGWIPGRPRRKVGVRSMLHYGGTITVNNVVCYLAYNAEKVLLGRFWGTETLGLYGRAYQLINLPTENLNSVLGFVSFPALSRVQSDAGRLRTYFLEGYGLFLSLVIPVTVACAMFSDDIIRVMLGPQWREAAALFRLLSPTILSFAVINPFAWLMLAQGQAVRSLKIALMIAPVVILGYVAGLGHGPQGVALGYSVAVLAVAVPAVLWAKHGTLITGKDILRAIVRPLTSALVGAGVVLATSRFIDRIEPAFVRLVLSTTVLFGVYLLCLLFVMGQKARYVRVLRDSGLWSSGNR
jgi:O-antigen/teichoic acid export membrane protein